MYQVIAVLFGNTEEKQGKYKTRAAAQARVTGLLKHYPAVILKCKIVATGKDKAKK